MIKTQSPVTDAAIAFFSEHAGFSYDPKVETPEEGRQNSALHYAKAEQFAKERGWTAEWRDDPEPYEMGDAEETPPSEVLGCVLKDSSGEVLASLWQIGDPTRAYRRVVEAELASEAIADAPHRFQRAIFQLALDLQTELIHAATEYGGAEITRSTAEPIRRSALAITELGAILLDRCDAAEKTTQRKSYEYKVRRALGYTVP
jgi:hypothetical protein